MAYFGKYETPDDLLRDETINRQEKIQMLEDWRDDKKDHLRASEEGMEGVDRAERLRQIKKALRTLQDDPSE